MSRRLSALLVLSVGLSVWIVIAALSRDPPGPPDAVQSPALPSIEGPASSHAVAEASASSAPTGTPTLAPTLEPTSIPIESVPVKDGFAHTNAFHSPPFYILFIRGATVVKIEGLDSRTGEHWIAVSTEGTKVKEANCKRQEFGASDGKTHRITTCQYTGATFWLKIKPGTEIYDGQAKTGTGPGDLAEFLVVGARLREISILFGNFQPGLTADKAETRVNGASLAELKARLGERDIRSTRTFMFIPENIVPN